MANKRITEMDIRKILELYFKKTGIREMHRMLKLHRKTVKKYIFVAESNGLTQATIDAMEDMELNKLFPFHKTPKTDRFSELDDFFDTNEALQKLKGFTIKNFYDIYQEAFPTGLGRASFYDYFHQKYKAEKGSYKFNHIYGDKLMIDFAGDKLKYIDKETGEVIEVEVFVGILPASGYLFVKAVHSQKIADFVDCITENLAYIGGVPKCIMMDNLKSAVIKATKYEPVLNNSLKDLAHHYQCVAMPTRTYSPKDKAMVEGGVKIVRDALYMNINRQEYYSLAELNQAIKQGLAKLNQRPLTNSTESRYSQFMEERKHLQPLPESPFELWEYKQYNVQKMGYVLLTPMKNYYSVPYRFIGKQIKVRHNTHTVECYYDGECIAKHRISYKPNSYQTIYEHLHSSNQSYADWSPEKFIKMATEKVGYKTALYIKAMIEKSSYPETSYRSALAIIALAKKYPVGRIERVSELGMTATTMSGGVLLTMQKNNMDKVPNNNKDDPQLAIIIPLHPNIRGSGYYQ